MRRSILFTAYAAYLPYALIAVAHVALLLAQNSLARPTKLMLMPLLGIAAVWASARIRPWPRGAMLLLLFAVLASWLGDGAAQFFPGLPELPMMLLCFGIAHIAYMLLFWRARGIARQRRLSRWSAVYALWWITLVAMLAQRLGDLLVPVMIYGLVLGGTAALASRCGPVVAWGGAWFLASDTILAFLLFMPEATPRWLDGGVMASYTLGQGLIAYGVVRALAQRGEASQDW